MWWNKGYQRRDKALSGIMTQVHGIAVSLRQQGRFRTLVFDSAEYMLQPHQESGFFIITRISNFTVQHYDKCSEARDLEDAYCWNDNHCKAGYTAGQSMRSPCGKLPVNWVIDIDANEHGIFTGKCKTSTSSCEIFGWCPVQEDLDTLHAGYLKSSDGTELLTEPEEENEEHNIFHAAKRSKFGFRIQEPSNDELYEPMTEVLNFTVFIKNTVEFPRFHVARQNVLSWMDEDYVRSCIYNPNDKLDKYCPNFRIGDILDFAGSNKYRLLRQGGTIAITIDWRCDLDWSLERCVPRYDFLHLDNTGSAQGWPMEVARQLGHSKRAPAGPRRLLTKVNGIQFLIIVTGTAGRFNLFIFTMNFGSNLALMGLASIVCDYFLFHCTRDKNRFTRATRTVLVDTDDV
ncbi:hypothetical protein P879_11549 [Paragonimus westermani]|uniref:P2X purinoceptor 4 n=1 Tax=Paragonimus westermani TaxID=34504 RepID=A0A8T0D9M8_9TREM|nr:hypothetical protein P879_11549 [Paragonimus westermani]